MGLDAAFEALAGVAGRAEAWYRMHPQFTAAPGGPGRKSEDLRPTEVSAATVAPLKVTSAIYLPLVVGSVSEIPTTTVERRAICITRYDWTQLAVAPMPFAVDDIVAKVAGAVLPACGAG